jgi:hypothetical protein
MGSEVSEKTTLKRDTWKGRYTYHSLLPSMTHEGQTFHTCECLVGRTPVSEQWEPGLCCFSSRSPQKDYIIFLYISHEKDCFEILFCSLYTLFRSLWLTFTAWKVFL